MSLAERSALIEGHQAKLREWQAKAKIELRAIGTPGEVPVALFDVNDEPVLVVAHGELAGYQVTEIDGANARVTVTSRDKSERIFSLLDPRPVKFPVFSPQHVESLVSRQGRWGREDRSVPVELLMAWDKINREGKEAILLAYLQNGNIVGIEPDHTGSGFRSGTSSSQLFAKQISQRNKELRDTFLASLTPEQRERFKGGLQQAIRLTAPLEEREAQMAQSRKTKAGQDEVIAGLTPEQRKLYDAWRPKQEN